MNHTLHLKRAEHAYTRYCLDIAPGVTLRDLLKPEYWSKNADGRLRQHDVVHVRSDSEGFDCELVVKTILPGAGVVMRLDLSKMPGSAEYKRLKAIEAAAHAEQAVAKRAEIEAAIAGGRP